MSWALLLASALAASPPSADAQGRLEAGHRAFSAGRFEAALTEYRKALRLGATREAPWQIGVTLVQLGRTDDALEAFALAQRSAPDQEQPLQRFYRAVACLKARLWQCADTLFGSVGTALPGPMAAHAAALRKVAGDQLRQRAAVSEASLTWYEEQEAAARAQGRTALADAFRAEAEHLTEKARALRREGLLDPLGLMAAGDGGGSRLVVLAVAELGYDTNPLLLTASDPQKRNAGFPQAGGMALSTLGFVEGRPLGVSGPFIQGLVSHRAEERTWFDDLSLLTLLGTAGWRAVGPRSDVSVAYSFQHSLLDGAPFVSSHRVKLRAGFSAGPLWFDNAITSQYDHLLPSSLASLSGARHGTQSSVAWSPRESLRLAASYRVDLLFHDNAGVLFVEHGPTLEAEWAVLSRLSLALSGAAWLRAIPAGSALASALHDKNVEAVLTATWRPGAGFSARAALSAGRAFYGGRGEAAGRFGCTVGLAYLTHLF